MTLPNEFYITLVSDESSQYFKENQNSFFTNRLPKAINLNESFCVALTEIFIPPFKLQYPSYRDLSDIEEQEEGEEKTVEEKPQNGTGKKSLTEETPAIIQSDQSKTNQNADIADHESVSPQNIVNQISVPSSSQSNVENSSINNKIQPNNLNSSTTTQQPSSSSIFQSIDSLSQVDQKKSVKNESHQVISKPDSQSHQILPSERSNINRSSTVSRSSTKNDKNESKPQQVKPSPPKKPKFDIKGYMKNRKDLSDLLGNLGDENSKLRQSSSEYQSQSFFLESKNEDGLEIEIETGGIAKKSGIPHDSLQIQISDFDWDVIIPPAVINNLNKCKITSSQLPLILLSCLRYEDDKLFNNPNFVHKLKSKIEDIFTLIDCDLFYEKVTPSSSYFEIDIPIDVDDISLATPSFTYKTVIIENKFYPSLKDFMIEIFKQIPSINRNLKLFINSFNFDDDLNNPMSSFATNRPKLFDFYHDIVFKKLNEMKFDKTTQKRQKRSLVNQRMTESSIQPYSVNMIFVYSDIVNIHAYAEHQLELLRIIPTYDLKEISAHGYHEKFINPEFYPVTRNYFDSISIKIVNREYDLRFNKRNLEPVYIQLLFKKM